MTADNEFLLEAKLRREDPELHRVFRNCVSVMPTMLEHYRSNFPMYTDHSMRHAMDVICACNSIIGRENIGKMNVSEVYVLLMGIYMHDVGMGISEEDFREFEKRHASSAESGAPALSKAELYERIRKSHHEVSAFFVEKYSQIFEIGDDICTRAVAKIAKGHRVVDLMDETEYPVAYTLSDGSEVCLPYLAALVRLADEIDVGRDRNPEYVYAGLYEMSEHDFREFAAHDAIKNVEIAEDAFVLYIEADDRIYDLVSAQTEKTRSVLASCREAVNGRTRFSISQTDVVLRRI